MKRYVSSLTLLGASEETLARIIEGAIGKHPLEHSWELANVIRSKPGHPHISKQEIFGSYNAGRNVVKHQSPGQSLHLNHARFGEAFMMIQRATWCADYLKLRYKGKKEYCPWINPSVHSSRRRSTVRDDPADRADVKVSIRPATIDDAKAMAPLAQDLGFKGSDEEFSRNLQDTISDPAVSVYVAESEQSIVIGWAAAEQRNFIQAGRSLEITALVVAPDHRGRGVGHALMMAMESDALIAKLPVVRLRSSTVRVGTHEFYRAIGYEIQKTQHCFVKRLHR